MLKQYQTRTNIGVGLGVLAQILGRWVVFPKGGPFEIFGAILILVGAAAFIWGCLSYMQGKGYHPLWGLLGLLSIIGLIVLICFPDRYKAKTPA